MLTVRKCYRRQIKGNNKKLDKGPIRMRDKWTVVAKEDGIRSREHDEKIVYPMISCGMRWERLKNKEKERRGEEKSKEDNMGENRGWKMR